ncbi:MAG: DUF559 domain-containing protein [Ignavibacteriales bacterium]|nr:DUF559 domain-containing protein [Ignavibacteriales bacterium]
MKFFNPKYQKLKRQSLRNNATRAEKILWSYLRNSKLDGFKFRRQHGIDPYIVDFYCPESSLAVELDGGVHFTDEARAYDVEREKFLLNHNIVTLRFRNEEVFNDIDSVLQTILAKLKERSKHHQNHP